MNFIFNKLSIPILIFLSTISCKTSKIKFDLSNKDMINCSYKTSTRAFMLYANCVLNDSDGFFIINPRHFNKLNFSRDGIASILIEGEGWAYVHSEGDVVLVKTVNNGPDPFKGGFARYKEDNKIGFINKRLDVKISAQFDYATPFYKGYAEFCQECKSFSIKSDSDIHEMKNGNWGFINRTGKIVIGPDTKSKGFYRKACKKGKRCSTMLMVKSLLEIEEQSLLLKVKSLESLNCLSRVVFRIIIPPSSEGIRFKFASTP